MLDTVFSSVVDPDPDCQNYLYEKVKGFEDIYRQLLKYF